MRDFKLSENRNKNKVFLLNHSELEKRFDPFYYIPELTDLEKKVSKLNPKKLRHYVLSIGSGATPKTTESEKYYSDKENGIPFLRVQNLSSTGILEFDDCKYINHETHNNYLKRSQVKEGDLLIKITGVGRMAVSSIAPDGFVGNTNQHMVVVRTGNKKISEIIAAYINTDIGEKLASRRATGGTRPALDYSALLSMPIIYDEKILEISKNAVSRKQELETKAQKLLASIDDYLLKELGITLPKKDNSLKNRIFTNKFSEVSGGRFDPFYNDIHYLKVEKQIINCKYEFRKFKDFCYSVSGVIYSRKDERNEGKIIIRANNITLETNEFNFHDVRFIREDIEISDELLLKANDILMSSASGSKEHVGKVAYISHDMDYFFGGFMMVLRQIKNNYNQKYFFEFLQSILFREYLFKNLGGTNINNLNFSMLANLKIPFPSLEKQNEIAEHIKSIRAEAKRLQAEAKQEMENAKREIEKMILSQ